MILDPQQEFNELVTGFCADNSLSALDQAILEHCLDEWPMGDLAKQHRTTPTALHRRKRELLSEFREYLRKRGIASSHDIFDGQTKTPVVRRARRQSRPTAATPSAIGQSGSSPQRFFIGRR